MMFVFFNETFVSRKGAVFFRAAEQAGANCEFEKGHAPRNAAHPNA
jgi:hypothetical protein